MAAALAKGARNGPLGPPTYRLLLTPVVKPGAGKTVKPPFPEVEPKDRDAMGYHNSVEEQNGTSRVSSGATVQEMHEQSARKTTRGRGNGDAEGCAAARKRPRRCTNPIADQTWRCPAALTNTKCAHQ